MNNCYHFLYLRNIKLLLTDIDDIFSVQITVNNSSLNLYKHLEVQNENVATPAQYTSLYQYFSSAANVVTCKFSGITHEFSAK